MLAGGSSSLFNPFRLVFFCVMLVPFSLRFFVRALINLCFCLYFRILRYHSTIFSPQAIILTLVGFVIAFGCLNFGKEGYLLVAPALLNIFVSLRP